LSRRFHGKTMTRKIIQISSGAAENPGNGAALLFALADDGTCWQLTKRTSPEISADWEPLPALPQIAVHQE